MSENDECCFKCKECKAALGPGECTEHRIETGHREFESTSEGENG